MQRLPRRRWLAAVAVEEEAAVEEAAELPRRVARGPRPALQAWAPLAPLRVGRRGMRAVPQRALPQRAVPPSEEEEGRELGPAPPREPELEMGPPPEQQLGPALPLAEEAAEALPRRARR
jgi:hypothetical protein